MNTLNMSKRRRVAAVALALASVAAAGWGGSIAPATAHAATHYDARVGKAVVPALPRYYPGNDCYTVRPDLGGYKQANIHNSSGNYIGWVQVSLLFCTRFQVNEAQVIVHLRSGSVYGQATITSDNGGSAAEPSDGFGVFTNGDTIETNGILSPNDRAQACWRDTRDTICTADL